MQPIHISNLHKTFGSFKALDGLSLDVEEGSVHGFLGPNGAGKSTTIRLLLGLLHPDSGETLIHGIDPRKDPSVLKRVGYIPGDVALWPQLTGKETFRALESLRGIKVDRAREEELISAFDLDPNKRCRDYSTGNRRKVLIIAALSSGADTYIFDEPTAGLDPLMENVFSSEVKKMADAGATVLLSSHILSEVDKLCDYVTVIKQGAVVESGNIVTLRNLSGFKVTGTLLTGEQVSKHVTADELTRTLQEMIDSGATGITSGPISLEEMFLKHYSQEPGEEADRAMDSTNNGGVQR